MRLCPLGEHDAEAMGRLVADGASGVHRPGDRDQRPAGSELHASRAGARTSKVFAIEVGDGRRIGHVGLVSISWRKNEAELVVAIDDAASRGKGYGTEAVSLALEYGFTRTKLSRIYLRVLKDNERAIRCFEKCGFRKEWVITRRLEDGGPPRNIILMTLEKERFLEAARRSEAS